MYTDEKVFDTTVKLRYRTKSVKCSVKISNNRYLSKVVWGKIVKVTCQGVSSLAYQKSNYWNG